MDINRSTLNALYQNFRADFQRGFRSREDVMAHLRIATLVPSMTAKNVYPWLGQSPKMREWIGDRHIKSVKAHKFEIENRKFELTQGVERDAIEDDTFAVYSPYFEEMGVSVAEWPSDVVFEVLKDGETALGYDEQPFFSASHPHEKEGTVSNLQAGAATPWYVFDTTRSLKPLIWQLRKRPKLTRLDKDDDPNVFERDEFVYGVTSRGNAGFGMWQLAHKSKATFDATNLKAVLQAMRERTNDAGSSLGVRPNLIVVPPELEWDARELLKAERNAAGATNVLNGALEIMVTNLVRE